jgi:hypothetical protein
MADLSRFRSPYSSFAGLSSTYNSLLQNGYSSATAGYPSYNQTGYGCLNYANPAAAFSSTGADVSAPTFGLSSVLGTSQTGGGSRWKKL